MNDAISISSTLEIKITVNDPKSGEPKAVLIAEGKLTKADAGIAPGDILEEKLCIWIRAGAQPDYSDASISTDGCYKLTKADAGITLHGRAN